MRQFYFHWQLNGELIEDHTGHQFSSEEAACKYAGRQAASFIGGTNCVDDAHLGIEVNDGSQTRCIVRASIVFEKP
jgi:hypothetical protein